MKPNVKPTYLLVATKGAEIIRETYTTFKKLSKAHHAWERKGYTVSLPF